MSKAPRTAPVAITQDAAVSDAGARSAAEFADGHVDPFVAPLLSPGVLAGDPLNALREEERVGLLAEPLGALPRPCLLLVCRQPGHRRAGMAHPGRASYPLDFFTAEQLRMIEGDPKLELIVVGAPAAIPRDAVPGDTAPLRLPLDPLLAGQAAAAAVSGGTTDATPGLRAAILGTGVRGTGVQGRTTFG